MFADGHNVFSSLQNPVYVFIYSLQTSFSVLNIIQTENTLHN